MTSEPDKDEMPFQLNFVGKSDLRNGKLVTIYQVDVLFHGGQDYHAIGDTPALALMEVAKYWLKRTGQ